MTSKNKIFWLFIGLNLFFLSWHFLIPKYVISGSPILFKAPSKAVAKNKNELNLSTPYYLILDPVDNQILAGSNFLSKIYPASTTKLVTALTALNLYPLKEVISAKSYTEGKVMELRDDEKVTVETLVSALLIYSANDAAFNLANHYRGGVPGFVNEMNQLVKKYNLTGTHFTNYDGIHNEFHYSTLYDLSQIARLSLKMPTIKDSVKIKSIELSDIDNQIIHPIVSTNELLGVVPEIEGLKTGWTPEAGGCFIGLINLNGHYLLSLVAQSQDRFIDTTKIVNWAKENVSWGY